MIKKITLLFIAIITSVTFAQTTIGESDLLIQQPIQHGHTYLQLLQHLMALQSVDSPKP